MDRTRKRWKMLRDGNKRSSMWDVSFIYIKKLSIYLAAPALDVAYGIYFPDQGSNPESLLWEHRVSHWTTREVPRCFFKLIYTVICFACCLDVKNEEEARIQINLIDYLLKDHFFILRTTIKCTITFILWEEILNLRGSR